MEHEENILFETDFSQPEQVVTHLIKSAKNLLNRENCSDKDKLQLVMLYTTLKFHPYESFYYFLYKIKHIKDIEKTIIEGKKATIITKSIKNLTPLGIWSLELKNNKWKICDFKIKQGDKRYYSLFYFKTEKIEDSQFFIS